MAIHQLSAVQDAPLNTGFPEFTELGKQVEMLRIDRRLSKQHLARHAGISRQQLWRVMTGKSELTSSLRARLADALQVDSADLTTHRSTEETDDDPTLLGQSRGFISYLADAAAITHTLSSLPAGVAGRLLKRDVLNAIEDRAINYGHILGPEFFELRRRVLAGEL
jgi:transcriptional regulator with XRE-family HTH domain